MYLQLKWAIFASRLKMEHAINATGTGPRLETMMKILRLPSNIGENINIDRNFAEIDGKY